MINFKRFCKRAITILTAGVISFLALFPQAMSLAEVRVAYVGDVYINALKNSKEAKKNLEDAQLRLKNAAEDDQEDVRQEVRQKGKEYLAKTIAALIKYLGAMKNKAENFKQVGEADRTAIVSQIDREISWLRAREAELDGASADKLKEISQNVRERWLNIRVTAKKVTGQLLAARIKYLIEKSQAMAVRLQTKISELEMRAGADKAAIESAKKALANFNNKISAAREKQLAGRLKFEAISGKDNASKLFSEGQLLIKEANQLLKQAQKELVQAVKKLKSLEEKSAQ